jgi:hypothetical protein
MYQWNKGIARWEVGKTLYVSVPFTWLLEDAEKLAENYKGKVVMGGPGLGKPTYCEGFDPIIFHNPCATFTTRGCVNSCPFCAVPKLEPEFKEIENFRPAPVVCDNNLLAASRRHIERVVDSLKQFPYMDFNQGLDARRFTPEVADLLGNLRCCVRFALNSWGNESAVKDAIDLCRERTTKDIGVYCLIGFNDDPESAIARLELVRSWGIRPNPMRYQPLGAKEKNIYIHPNWTERQLLDVMKYYSRLRWYEGFSFGEYRKTPQLELF